MEHHPHLADTKEVLAASNSKPKRTSRPDRKWTFHLLIPQDRSGANSTKAGSALTPPATAVRLSILPVCGEDR
jgi:hypothetical protein